MSGWWTSADPARGNTGDVHTFAHQLDTRADGLETIADGALAAGAGTTDAWFGIAGAMWRQGVETFVPAVISPLSSALNDTAAKMRTYASEVYELKNAVTHAQDQKDRAQAALVEFTATDMDYQNSLDGQRRLQQIHDMEYAANIALQQLAEQRRGADMRAIAALESTPALAGIPADSLVAAGSSIGSTISLADSENALAIIRALEVTAQLAESPADDVLMAELAALLNQFGNDADVWSGYLEGVGGDDLVGLVDRLAQHNTLPYEETNFAAASDLAGSLRHGLSVASATWDDEQGAAYARQMIDGTPGRTMAEIGFFFSDPHGDVMGRSLTVAMATEMDTMEREDGDLRWGLDNGQEDSVIRFTVDNETPLSELPHGAHGPLPTHVYGDPTALILETLGEHPDAALEWMLGGPAGDESTSARMEYWFGERDSSDSFFLGPAALMEGAQHATGGILDPHHMDTDVWEQQATMMHDAITELADGGFQSEGGANPFFTPDGVSGPYGGSSAGAQEFARAIGNYLPYFMEVPLTESPGNGPFTENVLLTDDGPSFPVANVTTEDLGRLMWAASNDPVAIAMISEASISYEETILGAMDAGEISGNAGLERIGASTALRDAVVIGRDEQVSLEQIHQVEGLFDLGSEALSLNRFGSEFTDGVGIAKDVWGDSMRELVVETRDYDASASAADFQTRITNATANIDVYGTTATEGWGPVPATAIIPGAVEDYESKFGRYDAELFKVRPS